MFTISIEFKNGERKFISGLNRVQCEQILATKENNPDISYIGVLDERF